MGPLWGLSRIPLVCVLPFFRLSTSRGLAAGPDLEPPNSGLVNVFPRHQFLVLTAGVRLWCRGSGDFVRSGCVRSAHNPGQPTSDEPWGEGRTVNIASLQPYTCLCRPPDSRSCFDVPLRFVVALARNISIPKETGCGLCVVYASVRRSAPCEIAEPCVIRPTRCLEVCTLKAAKTVILRMFRQHQRVPAHLAWTTGARSIPAAVTVCSVFLCILRCCGIDNTACSHASTRLAKLAASSAGISCGKSGVFSWPDKDHALASKLDTSACLWCSYCRIIVTILYQACT